MKRKLLIIPLFPAREAVHINKCGPLELWQGGGEGGAGNIRIQHESIGENLHTTCTLYNYTRHAHFTITQDMHT